MARETIQEKAVRYLLERRLRVTRADMRHVEARCKGRDEYLILRDGDRLRCTCPARTPRCAHVLACEIVVAALAGAHR